MANFGHSMHPETSQVQLDRFDGAWHFAMGLTKEDWAMSSRSNTLMRTHNFIGYWVSHDLTIQLSSFIICSAVNAIIHQKPQEKITLRCHIHFHNIFFFSHKESATSVSLWRETVNSPWRWKHRDARYLPGWFVCYVQGRVHCKGRSNPGLQGVRSGTEEKRVVNMSEDGSWWELSLLTKLDILILHNLSNSTREECRTPAVTTPRLEWNIFRQMGLPESNLLPCH